VIPKKTKATGRQPGGFQGAGKTKHSFTMINSINHRVSARIRAALALSADNARIGVQMRNLLKSGAA